MVHHSQAMSKFFNNHLTCGGIWSNPGAVAARDDQAKAAAAAAGRLERSDEPERTIYSSPL